MQPVGLIIPNMLQPPQQPPQLPAAQLPDGPAQLFQPGPPGPEEVPAIDPPLVPKMGASVPAALPPPRYVFCRFGMDCWVV
jgi:hypothetical protein